MIDGRYPWVISLVREFKGRDGSVLGYIQVDLNYAIIEDLCKDIQLGSSGYSELGHKGGQRVKQLIAEGKEAEKK